MMSKLVTLKNIYQRPWIYVAWNWIDVEKNHYNETAKRASFRFLACHFGKYDGLKWGEKNLTNFGTSHVLLPFSHLIWSKKTSWNEIRRLVKIVEKDEKYTYYAAKPKFSVWKGGYLWTKIVQCILVLAENKNSTKSFVSW